MFCPLSGSKWGKPFQNGLPSNRTKGSKSVQALDTISGYETKRAIQIPERVVSLDKRDQETATGAAVRNSSGLAAKTNSFSNGKRVDGRDIVVQLLRNEFGGNTMVHNLTSLGKSKATGIPRPVEEQHGRNWEDKEKYKETGDKQHGDKRKDIDEKSHGKDKDKEKVTEKEVKRNAEIAGNANIELDDYKNVGNLGLMGSNNNRGTELLTGLKHIAINDGNNKKRKDMVGNGFLHESEISSNKMQRLAPHQLTDNRGKLEACRASSKSISCKLAVPNCFQLDKSKGLTNGVIEFQKPSASKPDPSTKTVVSDQITEVSKISTHNSSYLNEKHRTLKIEDPIAKGSWSPHPDLKYLNEVLTVPKVVDCLETDGQEWLFATKESSNELKVELIKEEVLVWSEAIHIESADVCALPYVIPY